MQSIKKAIYCLLVPVVTFLIVTWWISASNAQRGQPTVTPPPTAGISEQIQAQLLGLQERLTQIEKQQFELIAKLGEASAKESDDIQKVQLQLEALTTQLRNLSNLEDRIIQLEKREKDDFEKDQDRVKNIEKSQTDYVATLGTLGTYFAWVAAVFGTLITVVVVGFTILTYASVKGTAREEIEKLKDQLRKELDAVVESGKAKIDQTVNDGQNRINAVAKDAETHAAFIKALRDDLEQGQVSLASGQSRPEPETAKAAKARDIAARKGGAKDFEDHYLQGLIEQNAGNHQMALAAFQRAEDLAPDLPSRGRAMYSAAVSHWMVKRDQAGEKAGMALSLLDRIDEIYRDKLDAIPALGPILGRTQLTKGVILSATSRLRDAIGCFDVVIRRFAHMVDPELQEMVAMALLNRGVALDALENPGGGIKSYDELIRQFADSTEPALRKQVVMAFYNKGVGSLKSRDWRAGIEAFDQVARRYGNASTLELRAWAAKALIGKSDILGSMGDAGGEIELLERVVHGYRGSLDQEIRDLILSRCDGIIARPVGRQEPESDAIVQRARDLRGQLGEIPA